MITLIAAIAKNNVIGSKGQIPWPFIKEDMAQFVKMTKGHPIIMGRRTWDSLPNKLPGRTNIVVSRKEVDSKLKKPDHVCSTTNAIMIAKNSPGSDNIFVIGGGEIYNQFIAAADTLEITRLEISPEGDTFFPVIHQTDWQLAMDTNLRLNAQTGIYYKFSTYKRP